MASAAGGPAAGQQHTLLHQAAGFTGFHVCVVWEINLMCRKFRSRPGLCVSAAGVKIRINVGRETSELKRGG